MIIRDLQIDDIESLSELYYQFWNENSDIQKMKSKLTLLHNNEAYIFLCAIENEKLIGSVMGIVCEELYGDCRPFLVIENMVIDSTQRKKGIGKALFSELEKRAKERGCTQIILVTETDRKDACGFYESVGFHPTANRGYKKKI
ncbi:MAG: GNAT family N-acetyltransferase [Chitinispirillia bacterium]|nr:GNAT family N-acetyltransferase [Chitinispirillia bacterium]